MKYKLIHVNKPDTEHLCDKVTIDGFDYYVSDDESQIGENVLWVKQTYHGAEEYANYIGKVYILKKCFPKGKEIILKDFYPKKSLDEIRQSIKVFLEKTGKQRTTEQIEENAIKNQATSGNLYLKIGYNISENDIKKVIATNNPNIDIPKVVDEMADGKEIKELAKVSFYEETQIEDFNNLKGKLHFLGFAKGYNKSQETHPFSEEDMIEFITWVKEYKFLDGTKPENEYSKKELFELWEEQRSKIVYYNG